MTDAPSTLYEITDEMRAISAILDDKEIYTEEQVAFIRDWLEGTQQALEEKVDNYCRLISELEARADMRDAEASRLKELSTYDENKAKRLREFMKMCLEQMGIEKALETEHFKVKVVNNGGKAPLEFDQLFMVSDLPEDMIIQRSPEPNTAAIRKAIEEGRHVPGVKFGERGRRLSIR